MHSCSAHDLRIPETLISRFHFSFILTFFGEEEEEEERGVFVNRRSWLRWLITGKLYKTDRAKILIVHWLKYWKFTIQISS